MNGPIANGFEPNDAGHLVAHDLGGPGTKEHNIIPQSANINRGMWAQLEKIARNEVLTNGYAWYTLKPIYENNAATRPESIRYRLESGKNPVRTGDIANPRIKKSDRKILRNRDYPIRLRDIQNVMDFRITNQNNKPSNAPENNNDRDENNDNDEKDENNDDDKEDETKKKDSLRCSGALLSPFETQIPSDC